MDIAFGMVSSTPQFSDCPQLDESNGPLNTGVGFILGDVVGLLILNNDTLYIEV